MRSTTIQQYYLLVCFGPFTVFPAAFIPTCLRGTACGRLFDWTPSRESRRPQSEERERERRSDVCHAKDRQHGGREGGIGRSVGRALKYVPSTVSIIVSIVQHAQTMLFTVCTTTVCSINSQFQCVPSTLFLLLLWYHSHPAKFHA